MGDFQQNTITNRQAVLDYIDANTGGGGGGSQDLASVLAQGSSTGNQIINSPDTLSEMSMIDGQVAIACGDGINTNNFIQMLPAKIDYVSIDINNNDNTAIEQQATSLLFSNNTTGVGAIVNSLLITQNQVKLEHNNSGINSQQIYVDADSCNMLYDDGINIIDVELGLTNGFKARQTDATSTVDNYIQVKFDKVQLAFDDSSKQREFRLDYDGYFLKALPVYQDDAAAATAGLTQGYLYQTNGLGAAPLNVAGILMVKQ